MRAHLPEVGFSDNRDVVAPTSDLKLSVRRGGVLRGRVVGEEGDAVAAFDVVTTYNAGREHRVSRSAHTAGRYALGPIDSDSVQISFDADGFQSRLLTWSTIPRGRYTDLPDVVLTARSVHHLTGRVLDAVSGDGIAGATVVLGTSPRSERRTLTDAEGSFSTTLKDDHDDHVYVEATGYAAQWVAVAPGMDSVVVRLTRGGAIHGVLLAHGAPATGSVGLFRTPGPAIANVQLDESTAGAFVFEHLQGDYAVAGDVAGYFTRIVDVYVTEGQTAYVRIDVAQEGDGAIGGSVEGLLGDETASVTVSLPRDGDLSTSNHSAAIFRPQFGLWGGRAVRVGSDARFAFPAVPPGTYDVGLSTSRGRKVHERATVPPGGKVEVNFRLEGVANVLSGTVQKENSATEACHCWVRATAKDNDGGGGRSVVSDIGTYRIEGLNRGVYVVVVEERFSDSQLPVAHAAGEVEVDGGSTVFDIQVLASASLVGVVESDSGPVEAALVTLSRSGQTQRVEYRTESAFDGRFALGGVGQAEYVLRVYKKGYLPFESATDLRTSLAESVTVELAGNSGLGR